MLPSEPNNPSQALKGIEPLIGF